MNLDLDCIAFKDFESGLTAYVTPLTFGRGRICVGPTDRILVSHDHGY